MPHVSTENQLVGQPATRFFAEAWPETVIVQRPAAQLTEPKPAQATIVQASLAQTAQLVSTIVHQPGAQLPWKHHIALLDKLDHPADRLWYAPTVAELEKGLTSE